MKKYIAPKMVFSAVSTKDIVTVSPTDGTDGINKVNFLDGELWV